MKIIIEEWTAPGGLLDLIEASPEAMRVLGVDVPPFHFRTKGGAKWWHGNRHIGPLALTGLACEILQAGCDWAVRGNMSQGDILNVLECRKTNPAPTIRRLIEAVAKENKS